MLYLSRMMVAVVTFLLGLGLFLSGIFLFARYAERILGADVKRWLKRAEGRKWFYFLLGASVTAVIQSSSAASSIVVGLVGGGIVSVFSGILLLLGASIGSTITAQLIAFPVMEYGPLLVAIGLIWWTFGLRGKYIQMVGVAGFSLGLLFIGLSLMTSAFIGLDQDGWLFTQINYFAAMPWYMFLVGAAATIIFQSSSVTVGMVMAMVMSGFLAPMAAVPFVIGAATGTNITVNLASLITSRVGKIVARGFFVFRLMTALLAMIFLTQFSFLVGLITADLASARFVANAFTLFSVLTAIPGFLLVKQIAQAGAYLSPSGEVSLGSLTAKIRKKMDGRLGKKN